MPIRETNNQAWGIISPHITDYLSQAQQEFQSGSPDIYGGPRVAGLDPTLVQGINLQNQAALGPGQQLADQATQSVTAGQQGIPQAVDTLSGIAQGLGPDYSQNLADRAISGVNRAYGDTGTFGGARHAQAASKAATDTLADYHLRQQQARANASQALGNLGLSSLGYTGAAQQAQQLPGQTLQGTGAIQQAHQQSLIDADRQRFGEQENQAIDWIQRYGNLIGFPGALSAAPQTVSQRPTGIESVSGILGVLGGLGGLFR